MQGATFDQLAISLGAVNKSAMAYTALSRLTSSKGLFLLDFNHASLRADSRAVAEMERLRQDSGLPLMGHIAPANLPAANKPAAPQPPPTTRRSNLLADLDQQKTKKKKVPAAADRPTADEQTIPRRTSKRTSTRDSTSTLPNAVDTAEPAAPSASTSTPSASTSTRPRRLLPAAAPRKESVTVPREPTFS